MMPKHTLIAVSAVIVVTVTGITIYRNHHTTRQPQLSTEQQQALFQKYYTDAERVYQAGKYEEAITSFKTALTIQPNPKAYLGIGIILEDNLNKPDEALQAYRKAIEADPSYVKAYLNASNILHKQGKEQEALAYETKAYAINPGETLFHQGWIAYWNGDLEKAEAAFLNAQKIMPNVTDLYIKLGSVYEKMNNIEAARKTYQKAVDLEPNSVRAHVALSATYLAVGDYKSWGTEYEWRWKGSNWQARRWKNQAPLWDGSALKDKTILLLSENGLGDMIQFIRYIQQLKKQGARVMVQAPKPLMKLFSTCSYIDMLIPTDTALPSCDFMSAIESLPYYFPAIEDMGKAPYLHADQALHEYWKQQLANDHNIKVAICWHTPNDPFAIPQSKRSLELEQLAPLLKLHGVSFYSLQKDWPAAALQKFGIKDFGANFDSKNGPFMDTAAIMANVDLVITVDTSVAHLAGALGVPVWTMIPVAADVRWMIDRSDTPWYPSMRLFRATKNNDWEAVVKKVADALVKKYPGHVSA